MNPPPHADEPSWLVKDFHVLYRAADAAVKSTQDGPCPGPEHVALQLQLTRLRPAFELCEAERRGLPAPRTCTICNARGQTGKRARFIASSADGLQWFECGDHDAGDHAATFDTGEPRVELEPLEDWFARHAAPWFARHAAPLPGADLPMPVPGADPDAYVLEVEENEAGEQRVTNRCRHPLVVVRKGAAEPEPLGPGASAVLRPNDYVAQPTRVEQGRHALAKDELREAVQAAALAWLESWEDNEAVPDADELPAERALYAAAVALRAFEIDAKLAAESDEHEEPTLTGTEPVVLDTGMRVAKDDGELGAVLNETLATTSPPYPVETFRASTEALVRQLEDIPGGALHACEASPRLAVAVLRALLSHPHVVDAKDTATAGEFLAFALRGAQLGWHVRHAHPADVHRVANIGAPVHEPHRSAWLDGYRIGVETLVDPVRLTDAMRSYYDSHLVYRAPEALGAREREIIAAVEAERREVAAP